MPIGNRVREAHLNNPCPGGLGFPVTSASVLRAQVAGDQPGGPAANDHAARADGQPCARCTQLISPRQQVRCRPSGDWVHESCPPRATVARSAVQGVTGADGPL
jgi:hypothetical protein